MDNVSNMIARSGKLHAIEGQLPLPIIEDIRTVVHHALLLLLLVLYLLVIIVYKQESVKWLKMSKKFYATY